MPSFDVRDHGATGDGSTDDRAAVQATIDACAKSGGGAVRFPAGVYALRLGRDLYVNLVPGVHLIGEPGATLRVHPDSGDFLAILSSGHDPIDDVTIEGLTFDGNAAGNTGCNVVWGDTATYQFGVYLRNASRIAVRDCRFDPYCGVNAVCVTGTGTDVRIEGNTFRFARARAAQRFDTSTLYIDEAIHRIVGNVLTAPDGDLAAGGIETHNGNAVVQGNLISGFDIAVNLCSEDTPQATRPDTDTIVSNNVITRCGSGVVLWPYLPLRNVVVEGNVISLAQVDRNIWISVGVGIVPLDDHATAPAERIIIADNVISFQPGDSRRTDRDGASTDHALGGGIAVATPGEVSCLSVTGNVVRDAPAQGINLGGAKVSHSLLARNQITNAGSNPSVSDANRSAIRLGSTILANVVVEGNHIVDLGRSRTVGVRELTYCPKAALAVRYVGNTAWSMPGKPLVRALMPGKPIEVQ